MIDHILLLKSLNKMIFATPFLVHVRHDNSLSMYTTGIKHNLLSYTAILAK